MFAQRNLRSVLETAMFNKSGHGYTFADEFIPSPGNIEYSTSVQSYFLLLHELIAPDQDHLEFEFESMYIRTARAADAIVDSINNELDENATVRTISAAVFTTIICTMIAAVVTSIHMLCLTRRLLRRVQENLSRHTNRLDALPIMVYEFSTDNGHSPTFDYTSKAVDAIYGADISDAQVAIDMIHKSERVEFVESMKVSAQQLTPWIWTGRITNACGQDKVISSQSVPERDSSTRVRWTGAVQDVTNLHDALKTMERRLEFVPVFELVVHGEENTEILYLTPLAEEILGCKQTTPGLDILDYIAQEDRELVLTTLNNSAPANKWLQEFKTIAGSRVRACATGRLNSRGETVWTGVLDDVGAQHDLKHVRRERDMQETVAAQLKKRCNFLAHEVRNTLFPHDMMLEDMKERYPDILENIELMQAGYRTVGQILDRALMIAKYEAGEMTTKSICFDLVRLCKSLQAYAEAAAVRNSNQEVEVVYDLIDHTDSLWVVGDRQVCEQAATNLLSNAVKYGGGKPLKMYLSYDGSMLTFTVTDKGRGMSTEDLKTACVPFGIIRKGNDQTKGTGLGLPLTHAMVINAGGSLTLQSKGLGQGTVATMRLPLSKSTSATQNVTGTKQPEHVQLPAWVDECKKSPLPVRVLLVDDSRLVLKTMCRLCTKIGIPYETATNGKDALDLLTCKRKQYTLVLMDRTMPGLQGDVVCQKARAKGYKGVIVLLTGDQIPDPTSTMRQFGLSDILCKSGQQTYLRNILKHLVA